MADIKLTAEVRDILERVTYEGNIVKLPPGQLAAPLYKAVNAVLLLAGGAWNRSAGGHKFEADPRPALTTILTTGQAKDEKKALQAFNTPTALAEDLVGFADVGGCTVLEPSAGTGALAQAARNAGAKSVHCIEINEAKARELTKQGFDCINTDFLSFRYKAGNQVQRVIMNPPFTRNQDLQHVWHALGFLEADGRLVSVVAGDSKRPRLAGFIRMLERRGYTTDLQYLPDGSFSESGTAVKTSALTVDVPTPAPTRKPRFEPLNLKEDLKDEATSN